MQMYMKLDIGNTEPYEIFKRIAARKTIKEGPWRYEKTSRRPSKLAIGDKSFSWGQIEQLARELYSAMESNRGVETVNLQLNDENR